jgi:lipid-binding SYLF domain-containing protein
MQRIQTITALLLGLALITGCTGNIRDSAPGEDPQVAVDEARAETRNMARETLQELYKERPAARSEIEGAAGYAVFSNFGMKILIAGGGAGQGLAVSNTTGQEVFMKMAEVQAGLGFGAKQFRLVWVFGTQAAFDKFIDSGYEFGGQATLAAKTADQGLESAGALSVSPGVWLYQITDRGLAAEATVKGTRYYRNRDLN